MKASVKEQSAEVRSALGQVAAQLEELGTSLQGSLQEAGRGGAPVVLQPVLDELERLHAEMRGVPVAVQSAVEGAAQRQDEATGSILDAIARVDRGGFDHAHAASAQALQVQATVDLDPLVRAVAGVEELAKTFGAELGSISDRVWSLQSELGAVPDQLRNLRCLSQAACQSSEAAREELAKMDLAALSDALLAGGRRQEEKLAEVQGAVACQSEAAAATREAQVAKLQGLLDGIKGVEGRLTHKNRACSCKAGWRASTRSKHP